MQSESDEEKCRSDWVREVRERIEEGWRQVQRGQLLDGEMVFERLRKRIEDRGNSKSRELLRARMRWACEMMVKKWDCKRLLEFVRFMPVEPAPARYSVVETDTTLRITILPERGAWAAVIVELAVCAVLFLAAFGVFVIVTMGGRVITTNDEAPLLVRLLVPLVLLAASLWGAYKNVWHIAGRERITVTTDALLQTLSVGSLVRTRRFANADVSGLCVPLENGAFWAEYGVERRQGRRGMIQFDYRGSRKRLGIGLHVPEAQAILALLEPRLARR